VNCPNTKSFDRWQFRVRTFRRLARGWACNLATLNKHKSKLSREYDSLEKVAEDK
jgi:hypothetical protein